MTTDSINPLDNPAAAAAVANIATIHATLAETYAAGGDHRAASVEARAARGLLDLLDDGPAIAASLRLAALDHRVHDMPTAAQLVDGHPDVALTDADVRDGVPSMPTTGTWLVAEERDRQIVEEGFDAGHDLDHEPATLARAAGCYLLAAGADHPEDTPTPGDWPWDPAEWKPSTSRVRNMVKAAALLVAEVDVELQREAHRGALSPEDIGARSAPTPSSMFPCPDSEAAGRDDRCGQFDDPRTCTAGVCSHVEATS